MKLVTNTNGMFVRWGDDVAAIRMIAATGFDAFDISMDNKDHPIRTDGYLQHAKTVKKEADAIGIPVDCPTTAGEGGAWGIAVLAAYRAHVLAGGTLPLVDFIETVRH